MFQLSLDDDELYFDKAFPKALNPVIDKLGEENSQYKEWILEGFNEKAAKDQLYQNIIDIVATGGFILGFFIPGAGIYISALSAGLAAYTAADRHSYAEKVEDASEAGLASFEDSALEKFDAWFATGVAALEVFALLGETKLLKSFRNLKGKKKISQKPSKNKSQPHSEFEDNFENLPGDKRDPKFETKDIGNKNKKDEIDTENAPLQKINNELTIGNSVLVEYNGNKVPIYRGGSSFELKPGEFKVTPQGKYPARGLSLDIEPSNLEKYGGAHEITFIPDELQMIHTPSSKNPGHFDIIPKNTKISQQEFQDLLNKIKIKPLK